MDARLTHAPRADRRVDRERLPEGVLARGVHLPFVLPHRRAANDGAEKRNSDRYPLLRVQRHGRARGEDRTESQRGCLHQGHVPRGRGVELRRPVPVRAQPDGAHREHANRSFQAIRRQEEAEPRGAVPVSAVHVPCAHGFARASVVHGVRGSQGWRRGLGLLGQTRHRAPAGAGDLIKLGNI